jgi:DNA-binding MarR family transcriptional regulator
MRREELVQEIIENISKCQRLSASSTWKDSDLSHSQIGMLFMLAHHKQLQVKQIAVFLGVTKSAASQLLEPLTQRNLVARQIDDKDRRIVRFSLSPGGMKMLKKINKLKFAGFRSRLENLSNKELDELAGLSKKLAAGASKD